jgi:Recombination endonuclease VII
MEAREYQAVWRANNRDRIRANARRFWRKHKERLLLQKRNDPKVKEYQRKYVQEHKEEHNARGRDWKRKNKDKVNALARQYYSKHPQYFSAKRRAQRLRTSYGLSVAEFDALVEKQNKCCAICEKEFERTPQVDHDHKTGKVRGLLCIKCNRALGLFADDSNVLKNAITYLEKNNE